MVKWITIALDDETYFKFKEACQEKGKYMTSVIRELIEKFARGEIE